MISRGGVRIATTALALGLALSAAGCGPEELSGAPGARPSATAAPTSAAPTSPRPTAAATSGGTPSARPTRRPRSTPSLITEPSISLPPLRDRGIVEGADASWPQCPKGMGIAQKRSHGAPMPLDSAQFVVLGLTNGPGFYPNPCLAEQVAWARQRKLLAAAYSVISYPEPQHLQQYGGSGPFDARTAQGRLANTGYAQAQFNLRTMRAAGLPSPVVWLDVEPVPDFDWPSDTAANAAVVQGAARGYREAGLQIGVYSTPLLWRRVVGDLTLGVPEWRAAGQTSRAEALRRCGADRMIQGGYPVLTQWVEHDRDRNVTCPGESAYLSIWFHQL